MERKTTKLITTLFETISGIVPGFIQIRHNDAFLPKP